MANYQLQATIARKNEQRSRENEQKYQTYLYNTLVLLQEQMSLTDDELSSMAQEEIGMTLNDFNKIMPQK
jgi:hypothetical protein